MVYFTGHEADAWRWVRDVRDVRWASLVTFGPESPKPASQGCVRVSSDTVGGKNCKRTKSMWTNSEALPRTKLFSSI